MADGPSCAGTGDDRLRRRPGRRCGARYGESAASARPNTGQPGRGLETEPFCSARASCRRTFAHAPSTGGGRAAWPLVRLPRAAHHRCPPAAGGTMRSRSPSGPGRRGRRWLRTGCRHRHRGVDPALVSRQAPAEIGRGSLGHVASGAFGTDGIHVAGSWSAVRAVDATRLGARLQGRPLIVAEIPLQSMIRQRAAARRDATFSERRFWSAARKGVARAETGLLASRQRDRRVISG